MKNEIRVAASNAAHEIVKNAISSLVPVLVAKKEGYALDTGMKDENGKPIYAVIDVTVKNTEDTKTSQAFDLEACVQALQDKMSAPKKVTLKKEADPEAEAKRAKREEQKRALHVWLTENLTEQMTTTDIQNACPDMNGISVMQVGSWLTAIAKDDPSIQRDVVKGKPYYSKV